MCTQGTRGSLNLQAPGGNTERISSEQMVSEFAILPACGYQNMGSTQYAY